MDDLGNVFWRRVLAVGRRQVNVALVLSEGHLPGRERSAYKIMYRTGMLQRSLVVLPGAHEMVFVEVFEFGGFEDLSTVRQGCKIKLFRRF